MLFVGLGVINYEATLIYRDLTYGSFKYEIDEQNLFFNSGFNYQFIQSNSFLGLGANNCGIVLTKLASFEII